jgi:serine/threonine protein kinase
MLHMKKNQVEINVKDRIRIARDTATVFQYMHHLGIVHRDIKSHNVLIDNSLNVKVCDFGLAKFVVSFLTIIFSFLTLFVFLGRSRERINAVCRYSNLHGSRAVLKAR